MRQKKRERRKGESKETLREMESERQEEKE
jgi:hypothetical protein